MKSKIDSEKPMKWYVKLLLTIFLVIVYKPVTYSTIKFFETIGLLHGSSITLIIYYIIVGIIFWFIIYKIWRMKKMQIPPFRKNKILYTVGAIILIVILIVCIMEQNKLANKKELFIADYYDNLLNQKIPMNYSDDKITFSIPSELEQYKTSFGLDDGIILTEVENNSVLISITIVSSSTNNLEYKWAENCGYTTSCGHEKYSLDYFNLQYATITKLHPNLLDQSTSTFKDKSNQNFYEKSVLINENLIFGTAVVFDAESQNLVRMVYYYPSNLDNEFEGYKNTILDSLKFK